MCQNDQMKEEKLGRACSIHVDDYKCIQNLGWKAWREQTTWKTHAFKQNNTKMKGIGWEGVDWIHLAQDKDQWWVLVKIVMNLF
jgi:hypothetical protein